MKFILISPKNRTVYNFRGDLLKDIIARGYEVIVTGPDRIDVDKSEALGARFVEIPMQKNGTDPIKDIKYLQGLVSLFRKEKTGCGSGIYCQACCLWHDSCRYCRSKE